MVDDAARTGKIPSAFKHADEGVGHVLPDHEGDHKSKKQKKMPVLMPKSIQPGARRKRVIGFCGIRFVVSQDQILR